MANFFIVSVCLAASIGRVVGTCGAAVTTLSDPTFDLHVTVTTEAMGARCVVSADLDGDGDNDLVSASSTDNTVAWYENRGGMVFSGKTEISFESNGARIVATADIDGDGDIDVVAASYYDNTVRWFENKYPDYDNKGRLKGRFATTHIVTTTAVNAQGVVAADLDLDGDTDLVTASSGDNSVAWYRNLGDGTFCEVKTIVDSNAIGVRTVVAADLDGDGELDLASASKDDNTVAWYPNRGQGVFPTKILSVIPPRAPTASSRRTSIRMARPTYWLPPTATTRSLSTETRTASAPLSESSFTTRPILFFRSSLRTSTAMAISMLPPPHTLTER